MSRNAGVLDVWLEFMSDWHVGTGAGVPGGVDRLVYRDDLRLPAVPASTLAGVVRSAAEEVAIGLDRGGQGPWNDRVVRLFGGLGPLAEAPRPSLVRFTEGRVIAELTDPDFVTPSVLTSLRASTAIESGTGVAQRATLRVIEVGRAGTVLHATIEHPDLDDADNFLMLAALHTVRSLGARRRRGLGNCRIRTGDASPPDLAGLWAAASTAPAPPPLNGHSEDHPTEISTPSGTDQRTELDFLVELLEPVAAQDRRRANELTTFDFIPGSLLLAALDRALGGALGPAIAAGTATIGDLVPVWDRNGEPAACVPMPRCLVTVKEAGPDDGYENRLRTTGQSSVQMKGVKGGWAAFGDDDSIAPVVVRTSGVAHAVIDDDLQRPTSDSGGLFLRHAIESGQVMMAKVSVPDHLAKAAGDLAGSQLRLGRASARGQGLVRITDVRRSATSVTPVSSGDEVVVLAASDVLVRSVTNRLHPDAAAFARELGAELCVHGDAATDAFVAVRRRDTWHGGWGLPRPSLVALAAGSVVRVRVVDANRFGDALVRGVGERTGEGFGRVVRVGVLEQFATIERAEQRPTASFAATGSASPATPVDTFANMERLRNVLRANTLSLGLDPDARNQAAALAATLKLNTLSRSQLGHLRRRARRASSNCDLAPVRSLIEDIEASPARKKRWAKALPELASWLAGVDRADTSDSDVLEAAVRLGLAARRAQNDAGATS